MVWCWVVARGGLYIGGSVLVRGGARARPGMDAGGTGGVRPSMVGIVRGWGGTEPCQGGVRGGVGACWWSGAPRAGAGRPGWLWCGHACGVFDSGSAGRAPANAGRGGGPGAWGWHGEVQGDRGCLLDMQVAGFWCWFAKWPWWWPCPWHGCLGLGFRAWGVWLLSRTCRGALGVLLDKLV